MLINTQRTFIANARPASAPAAQAAPAQESYGDGVSLGGGTKDKLANLAGWGVFAGGTSAAVGAGVYASRFMPSGMSGISGALTGAITGALAGGAAGFGIATASTAISPGDQAGDAMATGLGTIGGTVIGSVAGAVSGYFGAQPLLVAPATIAAGSTTMMGLALAHDAVFDR